MSVVANVVVLNTRTQIVTLRGVDHTVDLRIPDESQFKLIKVGDQVRATYTDAVAISMQPVAAKRSADGTMLHLPEGRRCVQ